MNSKTKQILFFSALLLTIIVLLPIKSFSTTGLTQGIQLFEKKKYTDAKQIFQAIIDQNKENAEAYYYLGRISLIENDYNNAAKLLEKAVKYDENSSRNYQQLAIAYGQKTQKAGIFKKMGLAKKMKNAALKAVELDSDNVKARQILFDYYYNVPGIAGGSKEKAKQQADEINKRDPFIGKFCLVQIYIAEKKLNLAQEILVDIIKEHKTDSNANRSLKRVENMLNNIGYEYIKNEQYEKAIEILKINTTEFPESANAWDSLAEAHAKNGEKELAIKYYEKALEVNAQNSKFLKNLYKSGTKALKKSKEK